MILVTVMIFCIIAVFFSHITLIRTISAGLALILILVSGLYNLVMAAKTFRRERKNP